ncbi:uncharacterized protein LOC103502077 isoform X7 [Cucumis melo]|uniref:Uncharacterized protein LOC103502077 isoform X7 n=1 Tax=Cucumis melo TaxID=3656 RepID=A0ABM3KCB1_CUCME|nr:uncharacterized protein LOC103502077 isoform X7 [Cucumis melo]
MQLSTTQISWTQGHPNAQPFLMLATQMHGDARSREDSCCSASTMFNRLFGKLEQEANALATLEKLSETLEMVEKKENDLVKKAVAAEVEEGRSCECSSEIGNNLSSFLNFHSRSPLGCGFKNYFVKLTMKLHEVFNTQKDVIIKSHKII